MAVIGTFGSFTAARLGIYASQASLNVTGNNIANINTEGYTRQRADLVSLHSGGNARYYNSFNLNIGYGVLVDSVSQLRDPFLDIRYRNENSSVGAYEARVDCLEQMAHILDEVGKGNGDFGILEAQFNDLLTQIENYNGKVGSEEYDTTVRGSAENLTLLFNDFSHALDTLEENKLGELKEDVTSVNTLLNQIRDLSVEIREAGIHGDKALELRDQRNVCIDKLSAYMKIDVRYDMEKIDEFNSVERLNISIADSGTPPIKLIQGVYGAQLSMPEKTLMRNPDYDPDEFTGKKYISRESDRTVTPPKIVYTDIEREANMVDDGTGNMVPETNPDYSPNAIKGHKYVAAVDENGNVTATTDDPDQALEVDNAVVGSEENRLWMTVEPLKDSKGKYMRDEFHKEITESVDLTDTQLYGSLQSIREFLTEKGEFSSDDDIKFDEKATQKRGIRYYKHSLDALARKFADTFNEANRLNFDQVSQAYLANGGQFVNKTTGAPIAGMTMTANDYDKLGEDIAKIETLKQELAENAKSSTPTLTPAEVAAKQQEIEDLEKGLDDRIETAYKEMEVLRQEGQLTQEWAFYNGGVLFSNNGDTNDFTNITAGNITISKDWSVGDVRLLNTKKPDVIDPDNPNYVLTHSTLEDNILHMINLMKYDFDYTPNEIVNNANNNGTKKYFTGSYQERLADINSILAVDKQSSTLLYNNYTLNSLNLDNSRQSVSGVDLNDEATNMMMFQKSYSAACQLMTTLDSMLDKLINGTIR